MNHKSNHASIDWTELDRLVDGRLNDDEYRQLLCQIDADPNGWKQCALAFLEHQALEKELGAFAEDPSCQLLPCMGAIVAEKQSGAAEAALSPSKPPNNSPQHSTSLMGWFSMALCIFSGLALGFTINSSFRDSTNPATNQAGSIVGNMNNQVDFRDSEGQASQPSPAVLGNAQDESDGCETENQAGNRCNGKHPCENRFSLENLKRGIKQHDPTLTECCPIRRASKDASNSCSGCSDPK